MPTLKLTLVDRKNPNNKKDIDINSTCTIDALLSLASKQLNLQAKKVYLDDGGEVEDMEELRDGDFIYVSTGETSSRRKTPNNTNNSTNSKSGTEVFSVPQFSLAVLGAGAVGKSALTLRYVKSLFIGDYDPTIEDAYQKTTKVDGKTVILDLLDTAGQDNFTSLRSHWMRNKNGLIFVFSLTQEQTVGEVTEFLEQCKQIYEEEDQPPTLLVGNKADCAPEERRVTAEQGKKLAEDFGLLGYIETSAFSGLNVDVVFETLVREALRRNQGNAKKNSSNSSSTKKILEKLQCTIL
jgi:small GTP-binding protein